MTHREWIDLLRTGDPSEIRAVLDRDPGRAQACDTDWLSALGAAIHRDDPVVVGWMLDAGADPNLQVPITATLSVPACASVRSIAVAVRLDAAGARWAEAGWRALGPASRGGDRELVTWLMARGARPSANLVESAWRDGSAALDLLLDEADHDARTQLLQSAADEGDLAMVDALLARGVDPRVTLALHRAAEGDHPEVVATLLRAGDDVNQRDPDNGSTPLLGAAFEGATRAAMELLARGADPGLANDHGQTALDGAVACGDAELEAMLRAMLDGSDAK